MDSSSSASDQGSHSDFEDNDYELEEEVGDDDNFKNKKPNPLNSVLFQISIELTRKLSHSHRFQGFWFVNHNFGYRTVGFFLPLLFEFTLFETGMEEPVAVTSQKHDPAWKHCQMFKNGDKVQLKCIYCGKIFKGGGIHRIKEHLAGQKGNAATCLRVQPDVRLQMLESLNGVAVKKRKKQKLAEEISIYDSPVAAHSTETANNNNGPLSTEVVLLPLPETAEHEPDVFVNREDTSGVRKKKGRVRKAPDTSSYPCLLPAPPTNNSRKISSTVNMAVGRFFHNVGLPPEAVMSAHFQPMLDAIASQGPGVVGPTYHDLRGTVLRNLVHETRGEFDRCASAWTRTGCTVLADERKSFVNFFAYCPEGTVFLRSADVSHAPDSSDLIFELLRSAVEEVGSRNVLQVVTGSDEKYILAGKRLAELYPTLFWAPCAGKCIDQMLDDVAQIPSVNAVLEQAKSVSKYVYSSGPVLNMMRRYTFGVDLVDLGPTRCSTDFMTLKRMVGIRNHLQSMVTSEEWMESPYSKSPGGFSVLDTDKIMKETAAYHGGAGDFGRKMAIRARDTLLPSECVTGNKLPKAVDPISYEHINLVEDWVVDNNKDLCSEGSENTEWMAVDPPLGNVMSLGPQTDDVEALGAGFDDYEIFDRVKDGEENGEDKIEDQIGCSPAKFPLIKAEEEDADRG
ncbi:hAT transposon superfamily [Striga asiatica]|uniref:HAT transposon superfamily n=1 Tax=Striga asiatica TaxID=4170 RepID=A0A5A7PUZ8_STRAF|nr:hAT transposon superfamily [Striga asiatica]